MGPAGLITESALFKLILMRFNFVASDFFLKFALEAHLIINLHLLPLSSFLTEESPYSPSDAAGAAVLNVAVVGRTWSCQVIGTLQSSPVTHTNTIAAHLHTEHL